MNLSDRNLAATRLRRYLVTNQVVIDVLNNSIVRYGIIA